MEGEDGGWSELGRSWAIMKHMNEVIVVLRLEIMDIFVFVFVSPAFIDM